MNHDLFTESNPFHRTKTGKKYWVEKKVVYCKDGEVFQCYKLSFFIDKALSDAINFNEKELLSITNYLGLFPFFTEEQKNLTYLIEDDSFKRKGKKYSKIIERNALNIDVWKQVNYYIGFDLTLEEIYERVGENLYKSDATIKTIHSEIRKKHGLFKNKIDNETIKKEVASLDRVRRFYIMQGERDKSINLDKFKKSR